MSFREDDIDHWKSYIHPEGQLYFLREETLDLDLEDATRRTLTIEIRFITELYLRQEETWRDAESAIQLLLRTLRQAILELAKNRPEKDISYQCLDFFFDFSGEYIEYYIVDPDRKRIFWLEDYNAKTIASPIRGVATKRQLSECIFLLSGKSKYNFHAGYAFSKEYWSHVEFYPHLYVVSKDDLQKLLLDLQYGFFGSCFSSFTH